MLPLQTFNLQTLYLIRNHYLKQTAKNQQHQMFLDQRIVLYTREIYLRESQLLQDADQQFTNLINELNHGSNIPISINKG